MPRYIDAEREIKEIKTVLEMEREEGFGEEALASYALMQFAEVLRNAPTADVAPVVHAHWIERERVIKPANQGRTIPLILLSCSNCGETNGRRISNYCPRCGAKMDGEVI